MKILEYGIYLTIFCLPLYLARFRVFGMPTNGLEAMIGVLFVIWLFKKGFNPPSLGLRRARGLIWSILLIVIGVSVATIFSWNLQVSAGIWKSWFIVPLLFFIVLISVIKNSEQVKKVFWSFILSGFVVSVISLVYLFQGNLNSQGRLQGFYNSPNYLAMYLASCLIICFGYYLFTFLAQPTELGSRMNPSFPPIKSGDRGHFGFITRSKIISKSFFLLSIICLLISILFTKSLGAWIGIIMAVCVGLVILVKNKKLTLIILGLALILILLLGYFKIFYFSKGEESLNARLLIWQKAWQVFKMHPVIGIGPGTFEDYFPLYPKWGVPQPHNLYLAFLLQTGIIGFIGFIWLLVWFFKKGFELLKAQNLLLISIMSTMVYILIHGLVDTTYWKNDLSIIFWLVIALLNIISRFSYSQTSNNFLAGKEISQ